MRFPSIRTLSPRQRLIGVMGFVLLGGTIAFSANAAVVDNVGGAIFLILSNIVMAMTKMFASLTGIFISILVVVARYNTFLNAPVVQSGWPIVRDLMNMMFIIALLIIAAGTVLRLQNYRYNRLLGKLIIMAFLVNFSKFIAVFLLQFAQVVMLTFVNAFRDAAFGNFSHMFGLDAVLNFANSQDFANQTTGVNMTIFISLVAGLAMMLVAFVVMLAITVMLFVRIIALWLLIIMSPIAYALRILPNTENQASTWWREFTKYTILGPVLAFFLWISLALVGSGSCPGSNITCKTNPLKSDPTVNTAQTQAETDTATLREDFRTEVLSLDRLMTFIVGIIFLMMGLQYAQKSGAYGASFAGKVATAGFGVASTLTGLNAIRDRTIAPVQGYFKERERRRNEAISRRTETLGMRVDQATNATIGQVGRLRAGATSAIGASARGVGQIVTGQATVREVGAGVLHATQKGVQEGTQGYRQAKQRIAATQAKRNAATDAEFNMAGRSKDDLMAMALNSTMNGATRAAAARQLAENNQLQDDEDGRRIANTALNSVRNVPEQYRKLKDVLNKNNPGLLISAFYNNFAQGTRNAQQFLDDIERGSGSLDGLNQQTLAMYMDGLRQQQLTNRVALDGTQLDPTNADDVKYAEYQAGANMMRELVLRAKSQGQLNGWLGKLDKTTRKKLSDGAYFDDQEINTEQMRWLADEGNVEEAYHTIKRDASTGRILFDATGKVITDYERQLAEQYKKENAKKIVENAESEKLSLSSLGSEDVLALVHATPGVDTDTVEKMTKDAEAAKTYARTMGQMLAQLKAGGAAAAAITARNGAAIDFDKSTERGRQFISMNRGLGVGAKGGYYEDSSGVKHNALEEMSVGYGPTWQPQADDQFNATIALDAAKYKYFTDDPTSGGYTSPAAADAIMKKFTENVTVPAAAKLTESIPKIVKKVVEEWEVANGVVAAGIAVPTDEQKRMAQKYKRTEWNETLAPFRP